MTITIPARPPIDVPLADPQTGKITKPWHDYLVKLEAALRAATP
jgi:hypothetical protein